METLHPAAQVTAIIVIGIVTSVFFLAIFTEFFDNITKNKNDEDSNRI
jgi:hypothetical protein